MRNQLTRFGNDNSTSINAIQRNFFFFLNQTPEGFLKRGCRDKGGGAMKFKVIPGQIMENLEKFNENLEKKTKNNQTECNEDQKPTQG